MDDIISENENENESEIIKENQSELYHDDADKLAGSLAGGVKINSIVLSEAEYDNKEIIIGDGVIRVCFLRIKCAYDSFMLIPT